MAETLENFIHEIARLSASVPFRLPVDGPAQGIPMYDQLIWRSMDISTIQGKVKKHCYQSPIEMHQDVMLMLGNCFFFNDPDDDDVYGKGLNLLSSYRSNILPRLLQCKQLYASPYMDVPFILGEAALLVNQCLRWRTSWNHAWKEAATKVCPVDENWQVPILARTENCREPMEAYLEYCKRLKEKDITRPSAGAAAVAAVVTANTSVLHADISSLPVGAEKPRKTSRKLPPKVPTNTTTVPGVESVGASYPHHPPYPAESTAVLTQLSNLPNLNGLSTGMPLQNASFKIPEPISTVPPPVAAVAPPSLLNGPSKKLKANSNIHSASLAPHPNALPQEPPQLSHIKPDSSNVNGVVSTDKEFHRPLPRSGISLIKEEASSMPPMEEKVRSPRKRKPSSKVASSLKSISPTSEKISDTISSVLEASISQPPSGEKRSVSASASKSLHSGSSALPFMKVGPNDLASEFTKKAFESLFNDLSSNQKDKVIDFIHKMQPNTCLKARHFVSLQRLHENTLRETLVFIKSNFQLGAQTKNALSSIAPNAEECERLDRTIQSLRGDYPDAIGKVGGKPNGNSSQFPGFLSSSPYDSSSSDSSFDDMNARPMLHPNATSQLSSFSLTAHSQDKRPPSVSLHDTTATSGGCGGADSTFSSPVSNGPDRRRRLLTNTSDHVDSDDGASPVKIPRSSDDISHEDSEDETGQGPLNMEVALSIVQEEREKEKFQMEQLRKQEEDRRNLDIYNQNKPICHQLKEREYNHTCLFYPRYTLGAYYRGRESVLEERCRALQDVEKKWDTQLETHGRQGKSFSSCSLSVDYLSRKCRIEVNQGEAALSKLLLYGQSARPRSPLDPKKVASYISRLDRL